MTKVQYGFEPSKLEEKTTPLPDKLELWMQCFVNGQPLTHFKSFKVTHDFHQILVTENRSESAIVNGVIIMNGFGSLDIDLKIFKPYLEDELPILMKKLAKQIERRFVREDCVSELGTYEAPKVQFYWKLTRTPQAAIVKKVQTPVKLWFTCPVKLPDASELSVIGTSVDGKLQLTAHTSARTVVIGGDCLELGIRKQGETLINADTPFLTKERFEEAVKSLSVALLQTRPMFDVSCLEFESYKETRTSVVLKKVD